MTFNTNSFNPFSGHAVVLVAYETDDPSVEKDGFGFLNSGWGYVKGELFWQSHHDMKRNRLSPLLFGNPTLISPFSGHFVVISQNGRRDKNICPIYPDQIH